MRTKKTMYWETRYRSIRCILCSWQNPYHCLTSTFLWSRTTENSFFYKCMAHSTSTVKDKAFLPTWFLPGYICIWIAVAIMRYSFRNANSFHNLGICMFYKVCSMQHNYMVNHILAHTIICKYILTPENAHLHWLLPQIQRAEELNHRKQLLEEKMNSVH